MSRYSSSFIRGLDKIVESLSYTRRRIGEYVNLWRKRDLIKSVKIEKADAEKIKSLWVENYGKAIPLYWHRLYASYIGKVDVNYFPEIYYSTILERRLNDPYVAMAYEDKSMLDIALQIPGDSSNHTIPSLFSRTQGTYYDASHKPITQDDALGVFFSCGKCVIKPSVDSDSGRGVRVLDCQDGKDLKTGEELKDVLNHYQDNYLVQSFVRTHPSVKALNPSSVNTIRIITYRLDGKVYHSPLAMRIGASNADVDNIHAGGLVVGLNDDGILNDMAFSEFGDSYLKHPVSGIVFKGYQIPAINSAIELVERCHSLIPRLTFISWDITITEESRPIIVEMNTRNQSAWFPQMVNGKSLFGDNTKKMIQLLKA